MDIEPYSTTTTATSATDPATIMIALVFYIIVALATYVISSFLLGRIFKKAGAEQWIAWVPVYNYWKMLEIGGQKGFWAILMFVPIANIAALVFIVMAALEIGKKLGKSSAFVLLYIFATVVWLAWLAFDSSTWQGGVAVDQQQPQPYPPVAEPQAQAYQPTQPQQFEQAQPQTPEQPVGQAPVQNQDPYQNTPPTPPQNPIQ